METSAEAAFVEQSNSLDFAGIESSDLARVHELSLRLMRDSPLAESLEDVLHASMVLLDADLGNVQLYQPDTGALKIVAQSGFKKDFLDYFSNVREGTAACGTAILRGERVVVEDVETDPIFTADLRAMARAAGYRAVQSTPLRTSHGQFLGILSTHFRQPHRPDDRQLRLLDLYAQQAERAIERKQAEESLRRKEQQLHAVADGATVVLAHVGRDLYKFVNKAFAARFGKRPEFYIGKTISETLGDAAFQKVRPGIDRVLRGESFESEAELKYPQIGRRIVRIGWTPEFNEEWEVVGWVNAVTDITEHALTECALRSSEQRLRTALEAGHMGWWELNLPTRTLSCSSICRENFGRKPGEPFTYQDLKNSIHPDDFGRWRDTVQKAIEGGSDFIVEYRNRWLDGSVHWVVERGNCTVDAAGHTTALSGISIDISERKQAEEEAQRFQFAVENSTEFIGMCDLQGRPFYLNVAAMQMVGLDNLEALRSMTVRDFFFPEDQGLVSGEFFRQVLRDDSGSIEIRFRHFKTGEALWMKYNVVTLKERGQPTGFATISQNITERKLAEQELHEARHRLENYTSELETRVEERTASLRQAVAQMEEFSYSVSHDLRAPIRAMNQYAKLLAEEFAGPLGDRGLHYVHRIIRSSERMNQLTADTLALSRVTRSPVDLSPVSLDTLVADIIGESAALQPPRALIEVAGPLGMVAGNTSLLTQAISNLLVNAAKFVPAGRIPHIHIWTEPVENMARLYIKDNGIGVAPEHQHRLFGIFQRIHPAAPYDGTGIGLAIVRKAVERLGGQVGMTSDGFDGSTFWIQLRHP